MAATAVSGWQPRPAPPERKAAGRARQPQASLLDTLAEIRAIAEIGSFYGTRALLGRLAPRGDGHAVMVLPGFMASDTQTQALRDFLSGLGYQVHAWELGRNPGLRLDLCEKLERRIADIREQSRRRVSLIGWSLGGMYARAIAHRRSDDIRQVITLGSPFRVTPDNAIGGTLARIYQRLNPEPGIDPLMAGGLTNQPTPVPSTSIFSKHDGIAPWQYCVERADEHTENIRVPGSHCGMTHNPLILGVVAERLGQREYAWRPFRPSRLGRLLYRPFHAPDS